MALPNGFPKYDYDINITKDEIEAIGNALKKEEFRNLLLEYVEEINDPKNRKKYEDEITQLEKERGVEVTFIHPNPGYVIKTSVNGEKKAFINICHNDKVDKLTSAPTVKPKMQGSDLSIPYLQAPPREDFDKNKNRCVIYDVVFHKDTLDLGMKDKRIKNIINETALNAVESAFKVTLDKNNLKFPKMLFKGLKHPTVIKKKLKNVSQNNEEIFTIPDYPYPPITEGKYEQKLLKFDDDKATTQVDTEYTVPKHIIKYRNHIDMQDFTNDVYSKQFSAIPNEIIVEVDLPLLKSANDLLLDVKDNSIYLISENPSKYKLKLNISYKLQADQGSAKFDKFMRKLIVTVPIKKKDILICDSSKDDSGVESDLGNVRNNDSSSGDDDSENNTKLELPKVLSTVQSNGEVSLNNVTFLNPDIHYSLPPFVYNFYNNSISYIFQVQNVDLETIRHINLDNNSGFFLSFSSMGEGYFPMYYAACVKFPEGVLTKYLKVEVWDSNVITQVELNGDNILEFTHFLVGTDENKLNMFQLLEPKLICSANEDTIYNQASQFEYTNQESKVKFNIISDNDDKVLLQITQVDLQNLDKKLTADDSLSPLEKVTRNVLPKIRTVSECVVQDSKLKKNIEYRGILKTGRSLSESSADDYLAWSDKNAVKKTVRFSDVVDHQSFRAQSSILGQRKKNQRKVRNKKRAKEKRLSECSGGESEGENTDQTEELEDWKREVIQDISDASSVSDLSESDDGHKEELNKNVSSKKHKRRGKKSARKNAHTAKIQFSNNLAYGTD